MINNSSYCLKTIREKAYKINCQVVKGFQHCREAVIYDENGLRHSGYMVKDLRIGYFVAGYNECFDFLMDLDEVVDFLKGRYDALGLNW